MDLAKHADVIRAYKLMLSNNPSKARTHDEVFTVLQSAAVLVPRFKMIANANVQSVLYDEYAHIAYTLNTFYNETIKFLVEGKKRSTNTHTWEGIFNAYISDHSKDGDIMKTTSIGATILNGATGVKSRIRNYGSSHQTMVANTALLSYADHEVFELWISQDNGVVDMVSSLAIMLNFTHP